MAISGRRNRWLLLGALTAVLLGRPASSLAQDAPAPRLGSLWRFDINAQETWLNNANFVLAEQARDSAFLDRAGMGLSYERTGRKSTFTLGSDASGVLSRGLDSRADRGSVDYSGSLAWRYQASPKMQVRLSETYSSSRSQGGSLDLESVTAGSLGTPSTTPTVFAPAGTTMSSPPSVQPGVDGLVFPLVEIRTNQTVFSLSYQPLSLTTLSASVRYDRMDFGSGAGLQNGSQLGSTASIGWKLGPVGMIGTSYSYSRTDSEGRSGDAQTVSANWSKGIGSKTGVTLNGSVGGTKANFLGQTDSRFLVTWNVGIALNVREGRKGVPSFQFSRNVSPAYGLGRDRIANLVSGGYTRMTSRRTSLAVSGSYSWSEDPADDALSFSSQSYVAAFRFGGQHLGTTVAYGLRLTDRGSPQLVTSHSVTGGLAYGWQWR